MTTIDRARLENLLGGLVRAGGSSLHLMPERAPWIRLEGRVVPVADEVVRGQDIQELLREFLFADHRRRLESGEEVEIAFAIASGERFRTAILPQQHGYNVVFRRVPESIPTLAEAGLPELVSAFVGFRSGLVVLTGFPGSGKRSTLAALIERINQERPVHVVTVERQIEYVHSSKRALIHQREVGAHVPSVAAGVQQASRQAADVIVVADLDDAEGLTAALAAVEQGKLVIASFEASCVVGAVTELTGLVPAEERVRLRRRLSHACRAVISQTLVRRRHGRGRVPLLEILIVNEAVGRAIRRGRTDQLQELMERGRGLGMQTSDLALRRLLQQHVISNEEAAWHATDRDHVIAR